MNSYATLLENMMDALLAGDTAPARALYRDKQNFPAEAQLSVYVHGYRFRLHKIIRNLYTATHYCLGKDDFKALVDRFIDSTPSHYYNIDKYAIEFGRYVAHTGKDTFICELAYLESTLRDVYHLPEIPALTKDWLKQQAPDNLTNAHLQLRIASRLMAFSYPVSDYITAFRAGKKPKRPKAIQNWIMVLRDSDEMQRVPLKEAEYILLTLVAERHTLGAALASERFAPFVGERLAKDFRHWFSRWISEGFLRMPY